MAIFGLKSREETAPQLAAMFVLTMVLALMIWPRRPSIVRWQGWLLLGMYGAAIYLWLR